MDKVLQDRIKVVADEVRYWAETEAPRYGHNEETLCGMCAIASAELWKKLKMTGIHGALHVAESDWGSHVFYVIDDHIVDVTATQLPGFRNKPIVILHTKEAEMHEHWRAVHEFKSAKELREFQVRYRWPKSQTATA